MDWNNSFCIVEASKALKSDRMLDSVVFTISVAVYLLSSSVLVLPLFDL
jgi:hypothetical protein